jgi:uncharacterized protein YcbX
MTARVAHIWRHPIKSHGREEVSETTLEPGLGLPWDRIYAVAHERSCFDVARPSWQPCDEFSIGTKSPRLQAIRAHVDERLGKLTLSHPDLVDITINPADPGDQNRFIQWVMPVSNGSRLLPSRLVRGPRAMHDTDFTSISIINLATHRAVEAQLGQEISPLRWRGNILIDGLEAWAERDLVGRRIRIGAAELEVRDHIERCKATTANPETGECDADTLTALRQGWGHRDMGIYAVVVGGGRIAQGDPVAPA